MKARKLLKGIVVIALIALLYKICDRPQSHIISQNTIHAKFDSIKEKKTMPKEVGINIDASGSMKGYFISDQPEFSGQLANLVGMFDKKEVFFVDNPQPYKGLITDIISDLRNQPHRAVTDFDKLLAKMCHKVESGRVEFLITDGIMSVGKTTPKALKELGYAVRDSLKHFSVAVAIFKFESEFKSDIKKNVGYWTCKEIYKPINVSSRPYYVIAVGTKEDIRALMDNKLGAKEEIYFGIHDHKGHSTNSQAEEKDSQLEVGDDPVILNATLPQCLSKLGKHFFEEMTEVYLNDDKVPPSAYGNKIIDEAGDINVVISQDATKGIPLVADPMTGYVKFTVKVRNEIPEAWTILNSDDDSYIDTDIEQQQKTYGLLTLIKGIKDALDPYDYLLDLKFYFKP